MLPKAGATQERSLEAVSCMPSLGTSLCTGTESLKLIDQLRYVSGNFIFVERINDLRICERHTIDLLEMLTKGFEHLFPRYDSHPCCEIVPTRREPRQCSRVMSARSLPVERRYVVRRAIYWDCT